MRAGCYDTKQRSLSTVQHVAWHSHSPRPPGLFCPVQLCCGDRGVEIYDFCLQPRTQCTHVYLSRLQYHLCAVCRNGPGPHYGSLPEGGCGGSCTTSCCVSHTGGLWALTRQIVTVTQIGDPKPWIQPCPGLQLASPTVQNFKRRCTLVAPKRYVTCSRRQTFRACHAC